MAAAEEGFNLRQLLWPREKTSSCFFSLFRPLLSNNGGGSSRGDGAAERAFIQSALVAFNLNETWMGYVLDTFFSTFFACSFAFRKITDKPSGAFPYLCCSDEK